MTSRRRRAPAATHPPATAHLVLTACVPAQVSSQREARCTAEELANQHEERATQAAAAAQGARQEAATQRRKYEELIAQLRGVVSRHAAAD